VTESWDGLVAELRAGRGRPAFVNMSTDASGSLAALQGSVAEVISVGQRVANCDSPGDVARVVQPRHASTLMVDIEALFTPELHLDVIALLRTFAQRCALVVVWPGRIAAGRLSYSLPGRADYLDEPAKDLVVLSPVVTHFPDEIPYTVERYPA